MLDRILDVDRQLFLVINHEWSNSFFDVFLPFMRDAYVWIPLYLFLIGYFIWKFRWRGAFWFLWCGLTIGLADLLSSQLIKKTVMRARPCHIQEELVDLVLRVSCGTGFSFTSSHATNHMALAIFIVLTTATFWRSWRYMFITWALIIGFAQIYVGVHYPVDVVSGFLLGVLVSVISVWIYRRTHRGIDRMPSA